MVSILVPVYGVEKYIEKCAVSLFEQTCNDIEYVFVDDCSPDNSIGILEEVRKRYPERDKVKQKPGVGGCQKDGADGFRWRLRDTCG